MGNDGLREEIKRQGQTIPIVDRPLYTLISSSPSVHPDTFNQTPNETLKGRTFKAPLTVHWHGQEGQTALSLTLPALCPAGTHSRARLPGLHRFHPSCGSELIVHGFPEYGEYWKWKDNIDFSSWLKLYLFCIYVYACMSTSPHVQVRRQIPRVEFLLPPRGTQGSNSGGQIWQRAPLPPTVSRCSGIQISVRAGMTCNAWEENEDEGQLSGQTLLEAIW